MDRLSTESPVEKARKKAGVPLLRLEQLTGIPRSTLRRQIANPLNIPAGDLLSIATALGVDDADLYQQIVEASR